MVENNYALPWALTVVACHFLPAIFFLLVCGPWEEIAKSAETREMSVFESGKLDSEVLAEVANGVDIEDGEEEKELDGAEPVTEK